MLRTATQTTYRPMPPPPTPDKRSALLLMDLQAAIVASHADADFLARIQRAIDAARRVAMPVIWVVVQFRPGYPEVSGRNRLFAGVRQAGRLLEGDPQSAIHPALQPQPQDVVVTKRRVGAFSASDLDAVLRAGGIDALVLAGISTSGVVLSTVRLAADLDFDLTVLRDGCCDADAEAHRVLTERIFPRQAAVPAVDEWIASLAAA